MANLYLSVVWRRGNYVYLIQHGDGRFTRQEFDALVAYIEDEMVATETVWMFTGGSDALGNPIDGSTLVDWLNQGDALAPKNLISIYTGATDAEEAKILPHGYGEIVFAVADLYTYHFDKDAIRLPKGAYNGQEWSNREVVTSGYHGGDVTKRNDDGRDPGNVWLETNRDRTNGPSVDGLEPLSPTTAVERCVKAGAPPGETVKTAGFNSEQASIVEDHRPHERDERLRLGGDD